MIGKRRLRYIEDTFDAFLSGLFKKGEMVEVTIKPISSTMLEVMFRDVSESEEGDAENKKAKAVGVIK